MLVRPFDVSCTIVSSQLATMCLWYACWAYKGSRRSLNQLVMFGSVAFLHRTELIGEARTIFNSGFRFRKPGSQPLLIAMVDGNAEEACGFSFARSLA